MAPATGTAVLVIGAFVLPGFVTLLLRERTYVVPGETTGFERLLTALAYSAFIYGLLIFGGWAFGYGLGRADVAGFYRGERQLGDYLLVAGLGLGLIPSLIAGVGLKWRLSDSLRHNLLDRLGISPAHGTPAAWDHFFQTGQVALVRATLSDGRVVAGYYGDESFAGHSAEEPDLFLERRWMLDGDSWFAAEAPASIGLWLPRDSVVSLELYKPPVEPKET